MTSHYSIDAYTKIVLTTIAIILSFLRLGMAPTPVEAQSSAPNLYVEPGTVTIRATDGGIPGDGKMMIDLKSGDVWGFPTNSTSSPYPVDTNSTNPPVAKPIYLGRFDLAAMKHP